MSPPAPSPDPALALVAYDGLRSFEYAMAADVFALPRPYLGEGWYRPFVVSPDRGRLRGVGGLEVRPDRPFAAIEQAHTIVLPGWRDVDEAPPARLLDALRRAHARGARLLSLCTGAFVLAATGLLDGRRATTHWLHAEAFSRRFPRVRYEPDVLYVDEGALITSAGSAAGLDACLHLVRRDFGVRAANTVARRLVVAPHREGGQAQFVEAPVAPRAGRGVGPAMSWALRQLRRPLTVAELAARVAMSERTFLRRFTEAAGMPPREWLARQRIGRAMQLIETHPDWSHELVAAECGYESVETFRAAFRRVAGVAPVRYRARFGGRGGALNPP